MPSVYLWPFGSDDEGRHLVGHFAVAAKCAELTLHLRMHPTPRPRARDCLMDPVS